MLRQLALVTVVLCLPHAALAGAREDWQALVDALEYAGPIGQVDYAEQLAAALEAVPDADLEQLQSSVDPAQLADAIGTAAAARFNAEDALAAADLAIVESLQHQGFQLPAGFSVRRLIQESRPSERGIWGEIQHFAPPPAASRASGSPGRMQPHSTGSPATPGLPSLPAPPLMPGLPPSPLSAGFPSATGNYPSSSFPVLCVNSPGRANSDTMIIASNSIAIARNGVVVVRVGVEIARTALEVTKIAWNGVDRVCKQTVVVLGAGGNPSVACVPADIVLAIAEAIVGGLQIGVGIANDLVGIAEDVVRHINNCDAAVADAELEASYKRLEHLHVDLEDHETALATHDTNIDGDLLAHDANIDADLLAHDANIDADLVAHDANIDADLVAHDANIDADLVAHDANIDADLIAHDANIDADLIAHDLLMTEEHEALLRLLEAQRIEIVLTSGGAPPVFAMPGGSMEDPAGGETCPGLLPAGLPQRHPTGLFERVRCITWGSIDRMAAMGYDTHVAESRFERAETEWAEDPPDFRAAVTSYSQAMAALMTPGSHPR